MISPLSLWKTFDGENYKNSTKEKLENNLESESQIKSKFIIKTHRSPNHPYIAALPLYLPLGLSKTFSFRIWEIISCIRDTEENGCAWRFSKIKLETVGEFNNFNSIIELQSLEWTFVCEEDKSCKL